MKNVLYVGPYRQNDEWGYTSKAFASLLASQKDINLVLRPIWFTGEENSKHVENLEPYELNNIMESKDVLIQHGLPSYINYNGDFTTNIGVLAVDSRIDSLDWVNHLRLMDKIVVFSDFEKELLVDSGIEPDQITALPFPPMFLINTINNLDLDLTGTIFYTTGSLDQKGGLQEILAAFLSTFSISDNAHLIVTCNNSSEIQKVVTGLKQQLGIFDQPSYYPNIIVIDTLAPEVVNYTHEIGDFFIDAGYNCIPSQNLLRAIAYNSIPIIPDNTKLFPDYDFYIDTYDEIAIYAERAIENLWSGEFTWKRPRMDSIRNMMKKAVGNPELKEKNLQKLAVFKQGIVRVPNTAIKELLCIQ